MSLANFGPKKSKQEHDTPPLKIRPFLSHQRRPANTTQSQPTRTSIQISQVSIVAVSSYQTIHSAKSL